MKVANDMPPAMRPSRAGPGIVQPLPKAGGPSFAGLLRANGGAAGNALPDLMVEAGRSRFAIETRIGEDAVRFDARPLVAPTAATGATDGTMAKGVAAPAGQATEGRVPTRAELAELVGRLAAYLPAVAGQLAEGTDQRPAAAINAARGGAGGSAVGNASSPRPASATNAPQLPTSIRLPANEGAAPLRPGTSSPLQSSPLSARLAALPREILIVLRGVTLSADEREALIDTVRQEVDRLGMGGRAIRIAGKEEKS